MHRNDGDWDALYGKFPPRSGARQIFDLNVEMVQTSCGFGVPLMEYVGERGMMEAWADKKGERGIEAYWRDRNQVSLDGVDTGILAKNLAE